MRKQCKVLKSIKPHFSLCFWINFFYLSFGGFCVTFLSMPRDSVVIRLRTRFFLWGGFCVTFFLCHGTLLLFVWGLRRFFYEEEIVWWNRTEKNKMASYPYALLFHGLYFEWCMDSPFFLLHKWTKVQTYLSVLVCHY